MRGVGAVPIGVATGALRSYMEKKGDSMDGVCIRATIPVNLRSPGGTPGLGNRFGIALLELPIGVADPLERVRRIQHDMEELQQDLTEEVQDLLPSGS